MSDAMPDAPPAPLDPLDALAARLAAAALHDPRPADEVAARAYALAEALLSERAARDGILDDASFAGWIRMDAPIPLADAHFAGWVRMDDDTDLDPRHLDEGIDPAWDRHERWSEEGQPAQAAGPGLASGKPAAAAADDDEQATKTG